MWAVVRYGLKSSVRDLFGKGPKGPRGPKNPSPTLSGATGVTATDKKSNNTQHEDLRRRPDVKMTTPVPIKAKDVGNIV